MNNSSNSEAAFGLLPQVQAFTNPSSDLQHTPDSAANTTAQSITATAVIGAPPLPQVTGLTHLQRIALQAIAAGQTATDAAQSAGVDRSTLYRWRTKDENFIAALKAWRDNARETAADKLLAAVDDAAGVVAQAGFRRGDVKAALTILKSFGTLVPPSGWPNRRRRGAQGDRARCDETGE